VRWISAAHGLPPKPAGSAGGALQFTPATLVLIVSEGEDGTVQFRAADRRTCGRGGTRSAAGPDLSATPVAGGSFGRELTPSRPSNLKPSTWSDPRLVGEHIAIVGIGLDRVRVEAGRDHLDSGENDTIGPDRVDRDLCLPAVGGAEQELAGNDRSAI